MAVQEVVRVLVGLMQDEGELLRARHGPDAVAVAQDLARLIVDRFEDVDAHLALWDRFQAAPQDNAADLVGVLEARVEADPALARRMDAFVREYHAAIAPPGAEEADTGERTVAVGGDALDTAVPLQEAQEGPEGREPYEPKTDAEVKYNASVERGTYLYGNVKGGTDDVGTGVGSTPVSAEAEAQVAPPPGVPAGGIRPLFEHLIGAIAAHPAMDSDAQEQATEALRGVRSQLTPPSEADVAVLERHLRELQRSAPDTVEVLLNALVDADLPDPVARTVAALRSTFYG